MKSKENSKLNKSRYDVVYGQGSTAWIDLHFCREWDHTGTGCYGTNMDHGFSFEEAKEQVIEYFKSRIEYYNELTEEQWEANGGM